MLQEYTGRLPEESGASSLLLVDREEEMINSFLRSSALSLYLIKRCLQSVWDDGREASLSMILTSGMFSLIKRTLSDSGMRHFPREESAIILTNRDTREKEGKLHEWSEMSHFPPLKYSEN